jgi:2'-hydroxyisoflavone reductase
VFVGRHLVEVAVERGHDVATFTRGRHNPDLFPGVAKLHGDRESDLTALRGGSWDAVVDTSTLAPRVTAAAATLLAGSVSHYTYVSSASAYRDWPAAPVDEESACWGPGADEDDYAARKAGAERAIGDALPGRTLILRPGLIVGPYENVGRLPYWLGRLAAGGEVLAAGDPERPLQMIDARDLAGWALAAIEQQLTGTFNVISPPGSFSMRELLQCCATATGDRSSITWVDDGFALAQGIEPWSDLPFWLPDEPGQDAVWSVSGERARAAGLRARPIRETARDTWDWLSGGARDDSAPAALGLSRDRERAALQAWHGRR